MEQHKCLTGISLASRILHRDAGVRVRRLAAFRGWVGRRGSDMSYRVGSAGLPTRAFVSPCNGLQGINFPLQPLEDLHTNAADRPTL